jgi:hypothetical protein
MKIEFSGKIFKKKGLEILNFMKIRPMGADLFYANGKMDGQTDIHDEANRRFS